MAEIVLKLGVFDACPDHFKLFGDGLSTKTASDVNPGRVHLSFWVMEGYDVCPMKGEPGARM